MNANIQSILDRVDDNESILLASDLMDSWQNYKILLADFSEKPINFSICEYSSNETTQLIAGQIEDIFGYISNDFFAATLLLELHDTGVSIYNDPSSNLSMLLAKAEIISPYIEDWDIAFCRHIGRVGVGFGNDGRRYVKGVITNIAQKLPLEFQRFADLSRCVGVTGTQY